MVDITFPCGFVLGGIVVLAVVLFVLQLDQGREQLDQNSVQPPILASYDEVIAAMNEESEQFLRDFVDTLSKELEKGSEPCRPSKPVT